MLDLFSILLLISIVTSGIMSGLFFVFSNFAMKAFGKIKPSAGIAAMQSINIVIINPLFIIIFLGNAIISIAILISSVSNWGTLTNFWAAIGGAFYILGCTAVTMSRNVPLNNKLAEIDPEHPDGMAVWEEYQAKWVPWNHLRTLSTILATAAFAFALAV